MKTKQICFVIAIIAVAGLCLGAAYQSAQKQYSFATMRAVSTSDDSGPAATGATWSSFNSGSVTVGSETVGGGGLLIRFLGDGTAGQTLVWVLHGASEPNEPFMTVAYGTAAVGVTTTGNAAGSGQYYCNTISVTAQNWPSNYIEATSGMQYNAGTGLVTNGGIALLCVDTLRWKKWKLQIVKGTATGGGGEFMNVTLP